MKRLTSAILFVVALILMATTVSATTSAELAQKLYDMGAKYGMTSADKVKIERYLADYPVTDEQANQIVAEAEKAVKICEEAGVKNYNDLSATQKEELKAIANKVASIVDVTLTFKGKTVEIYKNGKLIETITNNSGKLAYTGNKGNIVLVVSGVAVIALAAGFVAKKKINA